MKTYYLVQDLVYNFKHVTERRWYHSLFGKPNLALDECNAKNAEVAKKKFKLMGYYFGIAH